MATELAARGVSGETLARQLGHKFPDLRTTERYIKFDPRHLAQAKAAIEEYMVELDRIPVSAHAS
jgi:integrase